MSRLVRLGILAAAVIGFSAARAAPLDDFLKCADIAQVEARLVCYDAAAAEVKAISAGAPVGAPQVAAAPEAMAPPAPVVPKPKKKGAFFGLFGHKDVASQTAQTSPVERAAGTNEVTQTQPSGGAPQASDLVAKFGAESLPEHEAEKARVAKIVSDVDQFAFTGYHKIVVFLANGQVWSQTQGDTTTFRLSARKKYVAEISRGLLGSYNLKIEGMNKLAKVVRIK